MKARPDTINSSGPRWPLSCPDNREGDRRMGRKPGTQLAPVSHPSGLGIIPPPLSPHLSCHCVQLWHEMPPTQQGETIHQVPGAFHHLPLYLQTFHAQDFVGEKTEGNDPGGAVDVPGGANSHLRPLQNIDARRLRCAGGKVEVQNTQKGQLTETSKLEHLEETTNRPFLHCISQSPET